MKKTSVPALLLSAALSLAPAFAAAQTAVVTPEPQPPAITVDVAPPTLLAASAAAAAPSVAPSARPAGPVAESQSVALRGRTTLAPLPAPLPRVNSASNRAMMIVGAVGLVVGGIIGDDAGTIVMIGSAGIGLIGLYRFLN
ncbi:hypothetical protein [Gemmatimonas sp.]|uniref:hypothetical protein n=1 Tax=Gemmatimonas sp. TaxID=1962908 RepID=UPI00333E8F33